MLLLRRVYVVGGLLLAVGVALLAMRDRAPKRYKLVLDVEREARCYYETAWNDGEPIIGERAAGQTIVMSRVFDWVDDCTWGATETLTPTGPTTYRYEYAEHPIHCVEGATALPACSSIGTVTAIPLSSEEL
jgi:hypothetical protein